MKSSRRAALAIFVLTAVLCIAAVPASADSLYFSTPDKVYKLDTAQPTAAPTEVVTSYASFTGSLAASCDGSLFVATATGIARVDPAAPAGAATDLFAADIVMSVAVNDEGTRVWWTTPDGKVFTRALTPDGTSTELGTLPVVAPAQIARIGDQLILRNGANSYTAPAASAGPVTFTPLALAAATRSFMASNGKQVFYYNDSPLSIGTYDGSTINDSFASLTPVTTGLPLGLGANAESLWLFASDGSSSSVYTSPLVSPGLTKVENNSLPTDYIINATFKPTYCGAPPVSSAVPTVSGKTSVRSTLTGTDGTWANAPTSFAYQWQRCTVAKPDTCVNIPNATKLTRLLQRGDVGKAMRLAVTATNARGSATAYSALSSEVTAGALAILPANGRAANPTVHVRVPSSGSVTLTGTAKVGGKTVAACAQVKQSVAKGGVVHLTCTTTAAVKAARANGAVTVRLVAVYKPTSGTSQTTTRTLVLRALGAPAPVTG